MIRNVGDFWCFSAWLQRWLRTALDMKVSRIFFLFRVRRLCLRSMFLKSYILLVAPRLGAFGRWEALLASRDCGAVFSPALNESGLNVDYETLSNP